MPPTAPIDAVGALARNTPQHVSLQSIHLHLIREAKDKQSLARGMQGLKISFLGDAPVRTPDTWLLNTGWWKLHGRISVGEYPAAAA